MFPWLTQSIAKRTARPIRHLSALTWLRIPLASDSTLRNRTARIRFRMLGAMTARSFALRTMAGPMRLRNSPRLRCFVRAATNAPAFATLDRQLPWTILQACDGNAAVATNGTLGLAWISASIRRSIGITQVRKALDGAPFNREASRNPANHSWTKTIAPSMTKTSSCEESSHFPFLEPRKHFAGAYGDLSVERISKHY